jgi:hypothetical protein
MRVKMKQLTWLTPIAWVMLALYLFAAGVLLAGGLVMFVLGLFGALR